MTTISAAPADVLALEETTDAVAVEYATADGQNADTDFYDVYASDGGGGGSYFDTLSRENLLLLHSRGKVEIFDRVTREPWNPETC
ncbi:hypothetical protein [Saccharothrix hoggarensis]|uniref:Uncharacterized protein n=1 Tax=Saccharothrix hoggarensis TaxID=913853 RepID=A0ABW3QKP1_9PSEU